MTSATLPLATPTRSESRPRHRRSATFPTRLPSITCKPTLITPVISDLNPTTRIDILHPPTVPRRTVSLETRESQYHMHRRCALMRQQQWMREHGQWQKPFYGTAAVKEDYKSQIRFTLKTQMEDRNIRKQIQWAEGLNESVRMFEKDYRDCMEDAEKRQKRFNFLISFTRANKEIMDSARQLKRQQKILENKKDREQLQYNPINWSHTMK